MTSGVITTLGLLIGLYANFASQTLILGGIISIAVADAFSDALGVHVAEESDENKNQREIWELTLMTFVAKFIFALTFVLPILFFSLNTVLGVSILWGILVLVVLSYFIAKSNQTSPAGVIFEHLLIAFLVILLNYFLKDLFNLFR